MNCKYCGHVGPHNTVLETEGVHYARENCGKCGRWIRFVPKPEQESTKYHRPKSHTKLAEKYGRGFCELCLRKKEHFPKGTTLEAQHVLEFSAHEGSSERENIWIVCTACQRLIHWVRTYRYKHDGDMLIGGAVDTIIKKVQDQSNENQHDENSEAPF